MKKLIYFFLFIQGVCVNAQNIGVNATGNAPDASAMLDVASTSKGMLIPRVALTATNAAGPITSPATSLLVYNTATAGAAPNNVVPGFYYWNGSAWVALISTTSTHAWKLTGNAGTNTTDNFVGTTDAVDLIFRTNNTEKGRFTSGGSFAIGSSAFDGSNTEKLLVDAGTTSSYNLMTGKGSINNYLQINVKNTSGGTSASSDIVATSNNGTESINYIDMGINSGGYTNTSLPILGGINTAYLYSTGTDFVIGNGTASRPIRFFTGGFATTNERMQIDGTGKVGIGKTPTEALDISGNLRLSGAFMPNNSAGTSGYILQSSGAGAAPTWVTPASVASGANWVLDGNNVVAERTFGTTSNFDLPIITNNTEQMRIAADGSVGIGTSDFDGEKVLIDAGTTIQTAVSAVGNINNYLEFNVQNFSNGSLASSDIVATANNGTANSVYVDLGINSAGYSNGNSNILNGANVAYLYANADDFKIGNGTPNKSLIFFTNPSGGTLGTNTANGQERMRISPSGTVAIGTNNPNASYILHINGDAAKPGGGTWSSSSDRRLKKDIKPFQDGLSVLTGIKPVWFKYNGMGGMPNDGKNYVGIIAQEMKAVAPYTIGTFTDPETKVEYYNYDSNAVIYILINSVKEQQAQIEALTQQLEALNGRLTSLENKSGQ